MDMTKGTLIDKSPYIPKDQVNMKMVLNMQEKY